MPRCSACSPLPARWRSGSAAARSPPTCSVPPTTAASRTRTRSSATCSRASSAPSRPPTATATASRTGPAPAHARPAPTGSSRIPHPRRSAARSARAPRRHHVPTPHSQKAKASMPTTEEITSWRGHEARGTDGDKLGTIEDIYLDQETGEPEWLAIKTGLFGGHVSFAPLAEARLDGDAVTVPYEKAKIKDAPRVNADGELSKEQEAELYRYYGLDYSEARSDSGLLLTERRDVRREQSDRYGDPTPEGAPGMVGNDVSGPETDHAMPRSEEE